VHVCSPSDPECSAHAPRYTAIYGLNGSTLIFNIISQMAKLSETSGGTQNVCFGFLYNFV
jgi:hypothetical protein